MFNISNFFLCYLSQQFKKKYCFSIKINFLVFISSPLIKFENYFKNDSLLNVSFNQINCQFFSFIFHI